VVSTILLTTYISWRMGAAILIAFIYGVIISITIFVLFNYVLGLSLAKNYLGF
jgi:putative tricarboxylic transport membrane protein